MLRTQRIWILGSVRVKVLYSRRVRETATEYWGWVIFVTHQSWVNPNQTSTAKGSLSTCLCGPKTSNDWTFILKLQDGETRVNGPKSIRAWNSKLPQALEIYDTFPFKMCRKFIHRSHTQWTGWNQADGRFTARTDCEEQRRGNAERATHGMASAESVLSTSAVGPYTYTEGVAPRHTCSAAL